MRVITLRREGTCSVCAVGLRAGERAGWDATARTTTCLGCLSAPETVSDRGQAGASAARTYERRAERHLEAQEAKVAAERAWREAAKAKRPVLGRLASAVTLKAHVEPEPAHVRSWGQGAPGERRVGEVLDGIEGVIALHDRRVPGGRANIDHIVVTSAGVWVIDTKRYVEQSVERRDVGGLFRTDERLYVGGRDRTKLVDAMAWQVEVVTVALDGVDAPGVVRPMLCFVGSEWGWFPKPLKVRGVIVCWPRALPGLLAVPGGADGPRRAATARLLGERLPPA